MQPGVSPAGCRAPRIYSVGNLTGRFSLIDLVGIKQFLEENLSVAVDVTTRSSLHPMLRDDIEQSAVRVF